MPSSGDAIAALHAALAASPENAKLRAYLAGVLLDAGNFGDAEIQYRYLHDGDPADVPARVGLAKSLWSLGRETEAAEIANRLQDEPDCPPDATLLYARAKAKAGEYERAARAYRAAVALDPKLADKALEQVLAERAPTASERVPVQAIRAGEFADDLNDVAEKPAITFKDVGGMEAVKQAIRMKLIEPLANPEIYKAYGQPVGGGLLMYGPPGVGKTYLARATAGEAKAAFINIGISDILNMWLGNSEQRLHGYFDRARKSRPCVLFFDEIDALGGSRQQQASSSTRMLVNQFLSEMDGVADSNEGLFVVGATNAPWQLDAAFRRPGRFDRIIFVPPPDLHARGEILRVHCQGKPSEALDFMEVAKRTEDFSGADLKAVVDYAVEGRLQEAIEQQILKPLTTRDLIAAVAKVKPSTREWFATAKNYALYSNQGGIYDDIVKYLRL
jgi:transitional endoplasmic reticulum ATPase